LAEIEIIRVTRCRRHADGHVGLVAEESSLVRRRLQFCVDRFLERRRRKKTKKKQLVASLNQYQREEFFIQAAF